MSFVVIQSTVAYHIVRPTLPISRAAAAAVRSARGPRRLRWDARLLRPRTDCRPTVAQEETRDAAYLRVRDHRRRQQPSARHEPPQYVLRKVSTQNFITNIFAFYTYILFLFFNLYYSYYTTAAQIRCRRVFFDLSTRGIFHVKFSRKTRLLWSFHLPGYRL